MIDIPPYLAPVLSKLTGAGLRPILVGGCVRDAVLNRPIGDFDIEVYGAPNLAFIESVLSDKFEVLSVGKSFGVLKVCSKNRHVDISMPRTEIKTGSGHRGFEVTVHDGVSFEVAAARRDFTVNAMGYDPVTGDLLDPFNGRADLDRKILRAVGTQFTEDPLRVLRAAQFAGRLGFDIAPETVRVCQTMNLKELPNERVGAEFMKLLLLSPQPSLGFKWFPSLGIMSLFPELAALQGCVQDPQWHLEGNAWIHTLMVVDEIAKVETDSEIDRTIFRLAALCHDLGKPLTTRFLNGRWRALGHESAGLRPAHALMKRIGVPEKTIESVLPLVQTHMAPGQLAKADQRHPISDRVIRRLSTKVSIARLAVVADADHRGRVSVADTGSVYRTAGTWLLNRSRQLSVSESHPPAFITGSDLLALGFKPGREMGKILKRFYYGQISGRYGSRQNALDAAKKMAPR